MAPNMFGLVALCFLKIKLLTLKIVRVHVQIQISSFSWKMRSPGNTGLIFPCGKWLELNSDIPLDGNEPPVYHSPPHSLVYSSHPDIPLLIYMAWLVLLAFEFARPAVMSPFCWWANWEKEKRNYSSKSQSEVHQQVCGWLSLYNID